LQFAKLTVLLTRPFNNFIIYCPTHSHPGQKIGIKKYANISDCPIEAGPLSARSFIL